MVLMEPLRLAKSTAMALWKSAFEIRPGADLLSKLGFGAGQESGAGVQTLGIHSSCFSGA